MRLFAPCLLLALVAFTGATEQANEIVQPEPKIVMLEKELRNILECVRDTIKTGAPALHVPSLDPFKFPIIPLFLKLGETFDSKMLLTAFRFEGLGAFDILEAKFDFTIRKREFTISLKFDSISLASRYNGSIKLLQLLNIYGNGKIKVDLQGTSIKIVVNLRLVGRVSINRFDLQAQLPSVKFDIKGLQNDEYMSKLISEQLTEIASQYTQEVNSDFNEFLKNTVATILENNINPILRNLSVDDIIAIITGIGGGGGGGGGGGSGGSGGSSCGSEIKLAVGQLVEAVQIGFKDLMVNNGVVDTSEEYYKYKPDEMNV